MNTNLFKWSIFNWNWIIRQSYIVDLRSTFTHFYPWHTTLQKKQYFKAQTVNRFERKWETHTHDIQYCQFFVLLLTICIFRWNEEKHATLMRGLSIPLFWNGIEEARANPELSGWFKKSTHIFILLISNCGWHSPIKSVPESENIPAHVSIPDERMAYLKVLIHLQFDDSIKYFCTVGFSCKDMNVNGTI